MISMIGEKQLIRILTWNCGGALRKKLNAFSNINADIFIIQECEDPERANDNIYKAWARKYLWIGDNKNKGLGVFTNEKWALEKYILGSNALRYFIPCRINNYFNLIAVWAMDNKENYDARYIGQVWLAIDFYMNLLSDAVLIIGDFNSNKIWDYKDRIGTHSDVVQKLAEHRIDSFYHKYYEESQGEETQPTFYLHKNINKPYHIDYIFGSEKFSNSIHSLTVGKPEKWLAYSDHMPMFLEFKSDNSMGITE